MRVVTAGIVLICGLSIILGGGRLLARKTAVVDAVVALMGKANDGGGRSPATATDASSVLDTDGDVVAAELMEIIKKGLRTQPTESVFWLWLADTIDGRSPERLNAALNLATLTAPREPTVTFERVVVGLKSWDALNVQSRRSIVADLLAVLPRLNRQPRERVKAAIAALDPGSRQAIVDALVARKAPGYYLKRLGL